VQHIDERDRKYGRSLYTLSADSISLTIKRLCIAHAAFSHRRIPIATHEGQRALEYKDQSGAIKSPTACLHLEITIF
jgi:hypothetical protein